MEKKIIILFSLIIFIILFEGCSIKKNLTNRELEEIYYFKSSTFLKNLNGDKILGTFVEYDFTEKASKKKSMDKCKEKIVLLNNENLICKNKFTTFTNLINSSLN